jgi:hypothetical protein
MRSKRLRILKGGMKIITGRNEVNRTQERVMSMIGVIDNRN